MDYEVKRDTVKKKYIYKNKYKPTMVLHRLYKFILAMRVCSLLVKCSCFISQGICMSKYMKIFGICDIQNVELRSFNIDVEADLR